MIYFLVIINLAGGVDHLEFRGKANCEIAATMIRDKRINNGIEAYCVPRESVSIWK